jgi:hypothetical protein
MNDENDCFGETETIHSSIQAEDPIPLADTFLLNTTFKKGEW